METHSAWYLFPPKDAVGVDWSVFPQGHEHVQADESGFRGFIVEFYNIISDVVVQGERACVYVSVCARVCMCVSVCVSEIMS